MLKQRILTALILVPLVLLLLYHGQATWQISLMLLLTVIMGIEWILLIPIKHTSLKCLFIFGLIICIWINLFWFMSFLWLSLLLWVFALFAVLTFPSTQKFWGKQALVVASCYILLPAFLSCVIALYQFKQGKDLLLYLLVLVWATDIGAYFAGKKWGVHKLIVEVSPGKTIEGSIGGIISAMLVAVIGYFYFHPHNIWSWFITSACTILASMLGDLFISMLKRRVSIKDTGHILPGHGGVLDRMDSLLAACPIFYFGILVQQVF